METSRILRAAVWFVLMGSALLFAQVNTGTISGVVSDATGALVPGAQVTLKNVDTGASRTVTTNERGRYDAPSLSLGGYEVTVTAPGFETVVRSGITLTVAQEMELNVALKVGAVTEKIEVTAAAPLVETTTAAASHLLDSKTITDLPLNGRSFSDLLDEGSNVVALASVGVTGQQAGTRASNGFGDKFSVNGALFTQNLFLIDGLIVNDRTAVNPSSAAGGLLGIDTIREFRLLTSNSTAEYGMVVGGIMTAVTKSGTNSVHGSAFEFLRNSDLDKRQFFDPSSGPPPFKRNQFGGSLGGPIRKDKTFFFGSYEGLRQRLATTAVGVVPTQAARTGVLPTGTFAVGPVAQSILNLYPLPNGPVLAGGAADFISAPSAPTDEDYAMVKIDHTFNEKHSLFGTYSYDSAAVANPDVLLEYNATKYSRSQHVALGLTSLLSSTLLNSARVGVNRMDLNQGYVPNSIPSTAPLQFIAGRYQGTAAIGGGFTTQGPGDPILLLWTGKQVGDDLSYTRGNHSFKFGGFVERGDDDPDRYFDYAGTYTFASMTTFYAQTPSSLLSAGPGATTIRSTRLWLWGIYGQDEWHVRRNLTLTLGARWEFDPPPTDNFPNLIASLQSLSNPAVTVGGAAFQLSSAFAHAAPRVGLAWDPFGKGKTSVRAGFGVFDALLQPDDYSNYMDRMPPAYTNNLFSATAAQAVIFPNALSNFTLPGISPVLRLDMNDYTEQQPYVLEYNLHVQQQIAPQTMLSVGYSGSRGIHLLRVWTDDNQPYHVTDPATGLPYIPFGEKRPNPSFSQVRFRDTGNDSYFNALEVTLQKQFSHGFQLNTSYTFSKSEDVNSLYISQGTDYTTNAIGEQYPFNTKENKGLSNWNQTHYFKTNFVYDLPVGPGKQFLGNVHGIAAKLVEGWSPTGIFTAASGPPMTPTMSFDYQGALPQSGGTGHPSLAPGYTLNPVNSNYRSGVTLGSNYIPYYNPQAFVLPPVAPDCAVPGSNCGTTNLEFGNVGRNTIIGPGLMTLDFSLRKNTKLTERTQLQFRAEFFNIFNRANFKLPGATVFDAAYVRDPNTGRIPTALATFSRQIQLALKLVF